MYFLCKCISSVVEQPSCAASLPVQKELVQLLLTQGRLVFQSSIKLAVLKLACVYQTTLQTSHVFQDKRHGFMKTEGRYLRQHLTSALKCNYKMSASHNSRQQPAVSCQLQQKARQYKYCWYVDRQHVCRTMCQMTTPTKQEKVLMIVLPT